MFDMARSEFFLTRFLTHQTEFSFSQTRDAFIDILIPSDLNQSLIKKAERILLDENGNKKDYIGVHLRR